MSPGALDQPDAAGLEQHALAGVDVAHAAHDDPAGVETRAEAAVPTPHAAARHSRRGTRRASSGELKSP